jgi:histidine ammonia-lyase
MTDNLFGIIGIEALTATQGVDFRAPLQTGHELRKVRSVLRAVVPELDVDRYMAPDIEAATNLVANGTLANAVSAGVLPELVR